MYQDFANDCRLSKYFLHKEKMGNNDSFVKHTDLTSMWYCLVTMLMYTVHASDIAVCVTSTDSQQRRAVTLLTHKCDFSHPCDFCINYAKWLQFWSACFLDSYSVAYCQKVWRVSVQPSGGAVSVYVAMCESGRHCMIGIRCYPAKLSTQCLTWCLSEVFKFSFWFGDILVLQRRKTSSICDCFVVTVSDFLTLNVK